METNSGIHNLYVLNDLNEQQYSSDSENESESDSNSSSGEKQKYQTPIQPALGRRTNDSEKQKQFLSTQPDTN